MSARLSVSVRRVEARPISSSPRGISPPLDRESQEWLDSLHADGRAREEAIARLHALLLRAARFEVARRSAAMPDLRGKALDDLALESADDALVAVLAKIDDFRRQSRFTTWVYKFALLEAAVKMRRRPWRGREIPLEMTLRPETDKGDRSPHSQVARNELLGVVRDAIDSELTTHQREILVAVALNGVPIDVLAERLGTTRGALYKTIHDARAKLRRKLEADGYSLEEDLQGAAP
jgi:RNA polymerase sigma-70 factor (ECF subfamily)